MRGNPWNPVVADKPETALARWSRLKRAGTDLEAESPRDDQLPAAAVSNQETEMEPAGDRSEETAPDPGDTTAGPDQGDATAAPDLPDIASLNAESDFSVFLRDGVSEDIRRKALRVLWRSDPVLANLDGLNDYDEDFSVAHTIAEAVKTAYTVGKGYLSEEEGPRENEEGPGEKEEGPGEKEEGPGEKEEGKDTASVPSGESEIQESRSESSIADEGADKGADDGKEPGATEPRELGERSDASDEASESEDGSDTKA